MNPPPEIVAPRPRRAGAAREPVVALDGSKIDHFSIENGQYRYLVDLVRGLIDLKPNIRFVLLGSRAKPPEQLRPLLGTNRWNYMVIPRLTGRAWYYRSLFQYHRSLRRFGADLLHSLNGFVPCWTPCPVVATRHDIMYELFPEYEVAASTRIYRLERWLNQRLVRRVLASSATTASDVHARWKIPRDRLDVVMLGSDFGTCLPREDTATPDGWPAGCRTVLLTPYNLEPRKNLAGFLGAVPNIMKHFPDTKVVCYGRTGWTAQREAEHGRLVRELGLSGVISYTGFVSDSDLQWMYTQSTLFVFPTLYEGFGYPLLEAMACGACVAARNCSSMAEITGDCGVLTATDHPATFADDVCGVLADEAKRKNLGSNAQRRARDFSIEKMAQSTLATYARVLTVN